MNDELWNLMPMDSSLNSSKSNKLPQWDPFFARFAYNQYSMYELIYEKDRIHNLYEACYRDNLHSIWANQELYRKGNSKDEFYFIREKYAPVYDSARRQGYDVWNVMEVLHAICVARGYNLEQLEEKRREKAEERGDFKDRIFLEYVE